MWELLIPAVVAFVIKCFFLYSSMDSLKKNMFTVMLSISALHSLNELVGVGAFFLGNDVQLLMRLYYVMSVWWLGFALMYVFEVLSSKAIFNHITIVLVAVISSLFLFTDLVISGFESNGLVPTAVKADFYWIFQAFALGTIAASILLLSKQIFFSKVSIDKQLKCFYLLIGFLSPFITVICVIVMMQLGINISAVAIVPIATTLFVVFMVKSEQQHGLIDLRRFIPWSRENKASKKVNLIFTRLTLKEITLKEAENEFQKLAIEYQKELTNNNISVAAKNLGISRSGLYSKIEKLSMK